MILLWGVSFLVVGCLLPHGGPLVPKWVDRAMVVRPARIEGIGGSSPETALKVSTIDKQSLSSDEDNWMHERFWSDLKPPSSWEEFRRNSNHETKRIGRSVYDIVTVAMPSGATHTTYFNVTSQRFYWPREK